MYIVSVGESYGKSCIFSFVSQTLEDAGKRDRLV